MSFRPSVELLQDVIDKLGFAAACFRAQACDVAQLYCKQGSGILQVGWMLSPETLMRRCQELSVDIQDDEIRFSAQELQAEIQSIIDLLNVHDLDHVTDAICRCRGLQKKLFAQRSGASGRGKGMFRRALSIHLN